MDVGKKQLDKEFNRALIALVIPIALQNLISATVQSADVFMLGMVNQAAMSAVSLAGQITFILTLFILGLSLGAGVLVAQYWGKKDKAAIVRVLNLACLFTGGFSLIFFILSFFAPQSLMRLFTNDATLIQYGAQYQAALSWSYLAMGLSQIYLSVVKSMQKAKLCMVISSSCLILNIILNALCIFVFFPGMPEKATVGVAVSTVIARFIELALCVVHSKTRDGIPFRLPVFDHIDKELLKDYVKYTSPIFANYAVWGMALTTIASIIGHASVDMVAANSVVSVVKNLAIVLCGGISSGGSVLIGKYLGNANKEMAKMAGKRIYLYALVFGVIAGLSVLAMRPLVLQVVDLNDTAHRYLSGMLFVCAYYCIGKSLNSTVLGGVFSAGGDAKFSFWCDTVVMWGIMIPIGYLCAFVWQLDPVMLYVVLCLDEFIKLPLAVIRFRQYKWLKNITREFAQKA